MREIKFRAWDGEAMIILTHAGLQYFDFEGSYALSFVVDGYGGFWAHEQYETPTEKASGFPIMQYTGLKDKNRKEIYEGDIFQCMGGKGIDMMQGEIYFDEGCFKMQYGYQTPGNNRKDYLLRSVIGDTSKEIEIIGNIYENPELLTQVA